MEFKLVLGGEKLVGYLVVVLGKLGSYVRMLLADFVQFCYEDQVVFLEVVCHL